MKKALFLDRDGVINKEKDYLFRVQDFEFIEGVFSTCRAFQAAGYLIIVVTNQAGIARGKYTIDEFYTLNNWMLQQFASQEVTVSAVYFCPHHPEFTGKCDCRKPGTKMLTDAGREFDVNLADSVLVGDKNSDVEAGLKAGVGRNYLITTGHKIETNPFGVEVLDNIGDLITCVRIHSE